MEYREVKAKELCKYCRKMGMPQVKLSFMTQYLYTHSFLDAAGSTDYHLCEANIFLQNLDKFVCMKGDEWYSQR